MIRLRYKLIALVLFSVVIAIGGTVFFTTKTFLSDKRNYITELNSMAAPNMALLIDKILINQREHFLRLDDVLSTSKTFRNLFEQMKFVDQLNIYSLDGKLLIGVGRKENLLIDQIPDATSFEGEEQPLYLLEKADGPYLVLKTKVGNHLYIAAVSQEILAEGFEQVRALSTAVVTAKQPLMIKETTEMNYFNKASVQAKISDFFQLQKQPGTIAWSVETGAHKMLLVAMSPIPGARQAAVVVLVPDAEASYMASQVIRNSLPFISGVLIFVGLLGFIFSLRLTRSLEELTEAASSIALGNWNIQLKIKSHDEIGHLSRTFRKMGLELERRESSLKAAHSQLLRSERLAALGKFSAGIAHEIKNPLASILTYAQLIQRKLSSEPVSPDSVPQFASYIADETRRANRIIGDLLIFARQKAPTLKMERVSEIVSQALEIYKAQIQEHKAGLKIKYAADLLLQANMDRDQIYQVLTNLILNSLQAMEEMKVGERMLTVDIFSKESFVVIEVKDSGPGISEENMARIFEPFFSTKKTGKGTGLGLSLCLGIIEQHGGRIEVQSELGKGSAFHVFLPNS